MIRGKLGLAAALSLALFPAAGLAGQSVSPLVSTAANAALVETALLPPGGGFDLVERSDYRRYVDGRLSGFVYRESRASYREGRPTSSGEVGWNGELYLLEETIHDEAISARKVMRVLDLDLVASGGQLAPSRDSGFPMHRGLLAGRPAAIESGASWISQAAIALDPRNSGNFLLLPVLVDYRVVGDTDYNGSRVTAIKAKFAVRYDQGRGGSAGGELRAISGTHDLDIYLDAAAGSLVFIRDRFDESYAFGSGGSERHAGFTLVFYASSLRGERDAAIAALGAKLPSPETGPSPGQAEAQGSAGGAASGAQGRPSGSLSAGPAALDAGETDELEEGPALRAAGVDLLESPAGLVFRIKDLQFVADSDELLPEARARLDGIAAILLGFPGRNFLVEGHAAGVGKPAGELALSERRALRIVKELAARGLPASRFAWRGLGSSRPLAPNDTEEGRSRNRRVEITLLE